MISDNDVATVIAVGQPNPAPASFPQGSMFFYIGAGYLLIRTIPKPTAQELDDHTNGRLELRARAYDSMVHLCIRFGDNDRWCEAEPTGIDMIQLPPDCEPGMGMRFVSVLVDSDLDIIVAFRMTWLNTQFCNYLRNGLAYNQRFDAATYRRQSEYTQTKSLDWHAAHAVEIMVVPGEAKFD